MTLFLDFDGVTHPQTCGQENLFCRLPLIESVVREFAPLDIVISSSWRDLCSIKEMREYFSADLRERVIDVTPWLPGKSPEFERQLEIEAWMEEHRRWGDRWLALDDRPYWFRPPSPDLLVTDAATGFCVADQARLREMIKERL